MIRSMKYTSDGWPYWEWLCHGYVWQLLVTKARIRLVRDWWPQCPHPDHGRIVGTKGDTITEGAGLQPGA